MNRVADVHTQVDRPDHLVRLQIVEANCRWRRSTGHKAVVHRAQSAAKALARDVRVVDFVIGNDFEGPLLAAISNGQRNTLSENHLSDRYR